MCDFCGENFQRKGDLMLHMKKDHLLSVSLCINFLEGNCPFSENCWFVHAESGETFTTNDYQCNFCDKKFNSLSKFMKHIKLEHEMNVTPCAHALTG